MQEDHNVVCTACGVEVRIQYVLPFVPELILSQ